MMFSTINDNWEIVENIVEMGVLLLVMTYPQNKNIPLA